MALTLNEIENESLKLSLHDRTILAEHLIESIGPGDSTVSEELWVEEAEKRYQAYREGKIKGKPADKVFKQAYEFLKR